jgi:hypothetical protein
MKLILKEWMCGSALDLSDKDKFKRQFSSAGDF